MDTSYLQQQLAQYKDNYITVSRLTHYRFQLSGNDDELIHQIQSTSIHLQTLMDENTQILNRSVNPLLKEDYELNEDEFQILTDFAKEMIDLTSSFDFVLGLEIFKKLLAFVQAKEDIPKTIEYLYYCGFAHYRIMTLMKEYDNTYRKNPYFSKVYDYLPMYESFSDTTRTFFFRCMHNRGLAITLHSEEDTDYFMSLIHQEKAFLYSDYYRSLNPDFPWKSYERACQRQEQKILIPIRSGIGNKYLDEVLADTAELFPDSVSFTSNGYLPDKAFDQVRYTIADYISGNISCHELINILLYIYEHTDKSDKSINGITLNMRIPIYILYYISDDQVRTEKEKHQLFRRINKRVIQYILSFTFEENSNQFALDVIDYVEVFREEDSDINFLAFSSSMLSILHLPTYIHSRMVSYISAAIAKAIANDRPDLLNGFCEYETSEDPIQKAEDFVRYMECAGLLHDVGKLSVLEFVTQYARRIFDSEFECLKMHPVYGYQKLYQHSSTKKYAIVAACHHLTHDRRRGYPLNFEAEPEDYQIAVDIVAIADAIDAATDKIGRSYTKGKDFETLLDELIQGSGDRYNRDIVELIKNSSLRREIERILTDVRKKLYVETYRRTYHT